MKRTLLIIAAVLSIAGTRTVASYAQNANDIEALKEMLTTSRVSADLEYRMGEKGVVNGKGSIVLDGRCFIFKTGTMSIFCDGSTIWTVDSESREVYIDSVAASGNLIAHPEDALKQVRGFKRSGKEISGTWVDPEGKNNVEFKFRNVCLDEPSGSKEGFSYNTSKLDWDWVVTDLRKQ